MFKIYLLERIMTDEADYTKAVKVIGGHKSQITRAIGTLQKVVTDQSVLPADLNKVKAAKRMVENQVAKIEAQIDDLLGNEHFPQTELDSLTDYILQQGDVLEAVATLLELIS